MITGFLKVVLDPLYGDVPRDAKFFHGLEDHSLFDIFWEGVIVCVVLFQHFADEKEYADGRGCFFLGEERAYEINCVG